MAAVLSRAQENDEGKRDFYHIDNSGTLDINGQVFLDSQSPVNAERNDRFINDVYAIYSTGETTLNATSLLLNGKMVADGGAITRQRPGLQRLYYRSDRNAKRRHD